ncbi:phosphoribosylamine--glycine ligase [Amphibacillus sediminis]|uniref:phosphoribosylamine--glycine ligase n=1 Tax=Amphibacillus sediminis TaxID=360185 RepID=UPI00083635FD|nr:phosphoribosylamine--glycine ligase [Amphibacillus sediminis]
MKVLVIGSGGREHMLVKKLLEDERVEEMFVAPGNGGIAEEAQCIPIKETDIDALVNFARQEQMDWTIVGPELPLMLGIVNAFRAANLNVFGPTQEAAMIEGSKDFSKALMKKYQVPTANYQSFTNSDQAKAYIRQKGAPIVIKADGLAAGKGVVVALTEEQALTAIDDMLEANRFGQAGACVVIEEFLAGKEFSLFAFVNGESVYPMLPARDHKRAFDGDQGPNTGGMGAYSPVPDLDQEHLSFAVESILKPVANAMVAEGRPYTGVLYAGLIVTADGVKVIEFNARFGDPETQVVLPLLKNNLLQVIEDIDNGNDPKLEWRAGYAIGAVVASSGYPHQYRKGVTLPDLPDDDQCYLIHAGTVKEAEQFKSSGGRVLLVGAINQTLKRAQANIYHYLERFDQNKAFFYRKDIGDFE